MIVLSTALGSFTLLLISSVLWYQRVGQAKFYTIAWFIYLIGVIVYGLRTEGVLEHNFITSNFAHIGKFTEVLLLSFALGYKFNLVVKEKELLQNQLKNELEVLVELKTVELNKALGEKNILLKEVHHRVKNNLQVVSSILNMQSRGLTNKKAKEAVREGRSRIKSMALVHQKLYSTNKFTEIDMKDYIGDLSSFLISSLNQSNYVKMHLNCEEIKLPLDSAMPLGLILNELVTNSLKHAFADFNVGTMHIELLNKVDSYVLIVRDNGKGFVPTNTNVNSMGLKLVHTLVDQIDGTLELNTDNGTTFTIQFKS